MQRLVGALKYRGRSSNFEKVDGSKYVNYIGYKAIVKERGCGTSKIWLC